MTRDANGPGHPGALRRLVALVGRHPDASAALGLGLLPFAVLGRALLPGRVLSPADILLVFPPWSILSPAIRMANPLLTDVTFMFHPWLIYAGREIRDGRFPLWNPHSFTGAPFFANPQTALLFPLTWLAYALPPALAVTLISMLKLSLAGLGMYWFLRLLAVRPLAAVIGALAYMLNGALVTWLQWAVGTAMAMLPWLFAASERLRQTGARRWVAGLALVVGLSILGGYLQITALALLAAGAFTLCLATGAPRPVAVVARWGAGVTLGVLLAAVQLLPFIEYSWHSSVYFYRSQWMPVMAAPARAALALLMPYYFGSPTGRDFWGYWNFNEIAASVGVVPWAALPAALLGWRRPGTRFFVVMAALAALMCYDTPWITETLGRVPPFSLVIAFRVVTFLAFALSALAAFGIDALATAPAEAARRLRTAVRWGFVVLVALALSLVLQDHSIFARAALKVPIAVQYVGFLALATLAAVALLRAASPAARLALIAVQLASLVPLAATYNPIIEQRMFYPAPPPALRHVQAANAREPGRVMFGIGKNMGMLYGLYEVTGYDGMTPRRVEQMVSPAGGGGLLASGSINVTMDWRRSAFDLLGVRRMIMPRDTEGIAPHFVLEYDGPDARVWMNPRAYPRAFLVPRARCVEDGAALRLLLEGAVDPGREALLTDCGGAVPDGREPRLARAEVRADGGERVLVSTETDAAAYLVLIDTWFPGWRVRVDGAEQPLLRANHAFRAVRVPAGRHQVEFRYEPASLRWGLGLSMLATLAIAVLAIDRRAHG